MPISILPPPLKCLKCHHWNFVSLGQALHSLFQQSTPYRVSSITSLSLWPRGLRTRQKRGVERVQTAGSHWSIRLLGEDEGKHPLWSAPAWWAEGILVEEKDKSFLSKEMQQRLANGTWAKWQLSLTPESCIH